jgi:deoxyribodipyrimidine photo-lyase
MRYNLSVFWFRRDLRLHDNHGFFQALDKSKSVLPIFIFDTNILDELNENDRRVSLLFDRLKELNVELAKQGKKIHVYYGDPKLTFNELFNKLPFDAVFTNTDYEPYATKRDKSIKFSLSKKKVKFRSFKDQVIFEKDEILTAEGKVYRVYTYYMKKWKSMFRASMTQPFPSDTLLHKCITSDVMSCVKSIDEIGFLQTKYILFKPNLTYRSLLDYEESRDNPNLEGTSNASVHLRFGFLSIREVVKIAYQYSDGFLNELIWRSFFAQILWNYPRVVDSCFKEKYNNIRWNNNDLLFKWKCGETGFHIVDAGMRQLFKTGYMHNRVRMIAASFLVKNLGIDWRLGEAYFASNLMDYDLASNNGNWQWVAGTGCDAAPYFRVFNPNTQRERYDPNFEYCGKWINELEENGKYRVSKIVDAKKSRLEAIDRYKRCG